MKDSQHSEEDIIAGCVVKYSVPNVALMKYQGRLWVSQVLRELLI